MSVKWKIQHTSDWRLMYVCLCCGDVEDEDEHRTVCGQCGERRFHERPGRWRAYVQDLSVWESLLAFLGFGKWADLRFEHEFK